MSTGELHSPKAPLAQEPFIRAADDVHGDSWPDWALTLVTLLVVGVSVWAVYFRVVAAPFVFDDAASVLDNPSIVRLWPPIGSDQVPGPLHPPKELPTAGRPLANLTLALNYHFGRFDPRGYHAFNICLHILSAVLLGALVRRTLRLDYFGGRFQRAAGPLSLAVALVWAIHPLLSEAVVYVTQRTELLVGFFYLATIYASLRYWTAVPQTRRRIWLALATLSCLAGMASKEVMVTAPLAVLLYERTFLSGSFRVALGRSWPLYLGLAAGWILLVALNVSGPRAATAGFDHHVSVGEWWLTQAQVLAMYLKLAVWPWPLVIHYEMPYLTAAEAWPWLLLAGLSAIGTVSLVRRNHPAGFLAACMWLVLAPTLMVPIITEVAAERRMYLPLAALVTLVIVGGYALADRLLLRDVRSTARSVLAAVLASAITVAILLSAVTVRRLSAYESAQTLWQDTLDYQPNSVIAMNNLGRALFDAGRTGDALDQMRKAVQAAPNSWHSQNSLGSALTKIGQPQQALAHLEQALRLKPDYAEAHSNRGAALVALGRMAEAMEEYRAALIFKPAFPEAHNNLGTAWIAAGRAELARQEFEHALRLNPDYAEARYNLGNVFLFTDHPQEAIAQFEHALQLKPEYMEARCNLAAALLKAGRVPEAIAQFQQVLQDHPDDADTHENLARTLLDARRPQEAIEHSRRAADLQPNSCGAWANLAMNYAQLNSPKDAIAAAENALALARGQGQTALADQIAAWLTSYRARPSNVPQVPDAPALPPSTP